jgi:Protein of unknown function (DUF3024)
MNAAVLRKAVVGLPAHPNEFDRKRIERDLRSRKRYRYVSPKVVPLTGGYLVESPCCSRNIDADGGVIDIAFLHYDATSATWQLFRKDHGRETWELHSVYDRLTAATDELNTDPDRLFWQ